MELKLGIEVLESYKRLSYKVWYALAEFIDNSTQSYDNHKEALDAAYDKEGDMLSIDITYKNGDDGYIRIEDNSIGMDEDDLQRALTLGKRPFNTNGRSKYGLGLKTAAFWFGNKWEVVTKKLGHPNEYTVVVDLADLLSKTHASSNGQQANTRSSNIVVQATSRPVDVDEHYTIITITDLNRNIHHTTARRTKDYLRSIYRYDLQEGKLLLTFQGVKLSWSISEFKDRMLKDDDGDPFYREFIFKIGEKRVKGWVGILEVGSRRDAGFSLLQANRVIKGWPESYRPEKLFGEQEGGTNNLVNQRLVGELFLDDFEVSHTKDEIFFQGDEEEQLDEMLFDRFGDYKKAAQEYRKPAKENTESVEDVDIRSIVSNIFQGLQKPDFSSKIKKSVLPSDIIEDMEEKYVQDVLKNEPKDVYDVHVGDIRITIIINSDGSPYEPYLVIRARARKDTITIVINKNHKHWSTLISTDLIIYFIKQCIYDGIAEWRANFIAHSLEPETIKMIKDEFLRHDIELT